MQEVQNFKDIADEMEKEGYVGIFFSQVNKKINRYLFRIMGLMGQAVFWRVGRIELTEINFENFVAMTASYK